MVTNKREQNKNRKDIWERFSKLLYGRTRWKRITGAMMALVVFTVTYMLILPALTLDEQSAVAEPGIFLASEAGETYFGASDGLTEDRGSLMVDNEEPVLNEPEGSLTDGELVTEDAMPEEDSFDILEDSSVLEEESGAEWIIDEEQAENDSEKASEEVSEELTEEEVLLTDEEEIIGAAGTLTAEGGDYRVTLTYDESAGIPEGAELYAVEIPQTPAGDETTEYEKFKEKANDILPVSETISFARFFDISIAADGKEIHPSAPIEVVIELTDQLHENVKAVHFEEPDKEEDLIEESTMLRNNLYEETAPDAEETQAVLLDAELIDNDEETANAVSFETDGFSVFGIVLTETITEHFITASGRTLTVTVTYGPEAEIPEDAVLEVREILPGVDGYEEYYNAAAEAYGYDRANGEIDDAQGTADISGITIADISILSSAGEKIQPNAAVQVELDFAEPLEADEDASVAVVHFAENEEVQVLSAVAETAEEGGIDTISFETESFSVYSAVIARYNVNNLDGKTFLIGRLTKDTLNRQNGTYTYDQISDFSAEQTAGGWTENAYGAYYHFWAMSGPQAGYAGRRLHPTELMITFDDGIRDYAKDGNYFYLDDADLYFWKFERQGNGYTVQAIVNGESRGYLNINGANISITDNPQVITVQYNEFTNNNKRYYYYYLSNNNYYVNLNGGNYNNGYSGYNGGLDDPNDRLTLIEATQVTFAETQKARKVSAADPKLDDKIIIYQTDAQGNTYALANDGTLVPAFDHGDAIYWQSGKSLEWECVGMNGDYMYLKAADGSGNYLFPQDDGSILIRPQGGDSFPGDIGILLNGKDEGTYDSTLLGRTGTDYYGLMFDPASGNAASEQALESTAQRFMFARTYDNPTDSIPTVETVQSVPGLTITMYDWDTRATQSNTLGDNHDNQFNPVRGLVGRLGSDLAGATNLKAVFDAGTVISTSQTNTPFIKSIYDASGYYEFDSAQNYAYLDGNTWKVYQALGVPRDSEYKPEDYTYYNKHTFSHGAFLPYNDLDPTQEVRDVNLYDLDDQELDAQDPRFGERLYTSAPGSKTNYHFGMNMEAAFMMPKDGEINGQPMIYEFTGDDDFWLYIDDKLVLDIGGIHGAISGYINFKTGEVHVNGTNISADPYNDAYDTAHRSTTGYTTTLKELLGLDADTFDEYSTHTMKMYYMERGSGGSNLHIRFNLPIVTPGAFTVAKAVNGINSGFGNRTFDFQAFLGDDTASGTILKEVDPENGPLVKAVIAGTEEAVTFDADGTFHLKPGQAAEFTLNDDSLQYYIKEINIPDDVTKVVLNGTDIIPENGTATSTPAIVGTRSRVDMTNNMTPGSLEIKKVVEGEAGPYDRFRFRIWMEREDGRLYRINQVPYKLYDKDGTEIEGSFASGPGGTITISDGQTVKIEGLMAGTKFAVIEDSMPDGYIMTGIEVEENTAEGYEQGQDVWDGYNYTLPYAAGKIKVNTAAKVKAINNNKNEIWIYKNDDKGNHIGTAEFTLLKRTATDWEEQGKDEEGNPIMVPTVFQYQVDRFDEDIMDETGKITITESGLNITDIPSGIYELIETRAPNGYVIQTNTTYFEVSKETPNQVIILVDEEGTPLVDEYGAPVTSIENAGISAAEGSTIVNILSIVNQPGAALPATGGPGTLLYIISGLMLVMASVLGALYHEFF